MLLINGKSCYVEKMMKRLWKLTEEDGSVQYFNNKEKCKEQQRQTGGKRTWGPDHWRHSDSNTNKGA